MKISSWIRKTHFIGLYAEFLQYKKASFKLLIPVVPTNVIGTTEEVLIAGNKLIHLNGNSNSGGNNHSMESVSGDAKAASEQAGKLQGLFK